MTATKAQVANGAISTQYEQRGYTEVAVNLDHLHTMEMELKRERGVTESVQADVTMLREQLLRANERISGLEKVREQQAGQISQLEKVRTEQASHITKLEEVRAQQKSHIDLLV